MERADTLPTFEVFRDFKYWDSFGDPLILKCLWSLSVLFENIRDQWYEIG